MNAERELLKECIDKLDHYARHQGRVRMGPHESDDDGNKHQTFINPNPQVGQHYPAVQSLVDRIKAQLAQAFEGFVPSRELSIAHAYAVDAHRAGERARQALTATRTQLIAAQADNAKLREVLEKINRKSSHDFDDDSIYTLSKSALQSFRVAEKQV